MNRVILMGRLVRDPDVRVPANGGDNNSVARFTLAVDRRVRRDANNPEQQTADFISCVAFGYTANFAERYLKKGTKVVASGRIQTGSYTNKDGQKVYTTDVVVDELEFAESKNSQSDNSGSGDFYERPQPQGSADGYVEVTSGVDEELPFK